MSEKEATDNTRDTSSMDWMNMLTDFWGPFTNGWLAAMQSPDVQQMQKSKGRMGESMDATVKMWQAMFKTMGNPESTDHFKTVTQMTPDILSTFTQTCLRTFMTFQNQMGDLIQKAGQSATPYNFDNLDKELINRWSDTYQKELSQYLKIPQIGLGRFYQEKSLQALDKSNIFQAAVSEFLHMLYLPIEKSLQILQQKIADSVDAGDVDENPKTYYNMWIQLLEGRYMELFKKPEFTVTLGSTLEALTDFFMSRQAMINDLLKTLSVPTHEDLDELYKEIHLLKRRIRKTEKH